MTTQTTDFHFPTEIALEKNPLVEAWLEIRWQLNPGKLLNTQEDEGFPFALGVFYSSIKDQFGINEPLPQRLAPDEFLPHVVRYRFRKELDMWPVLQLGPGIASVNLIKPYTWEDFESHALYLRENLVKAYDGYPLNITNLILRYRNVIDFEYGSSNLLAFFESHLNTTIQVPEYIPGHMAKKSWPVGMNIALTYDLQEPEGLGTIRFNTGTRDRTEQALIFELSVESLNRNNMYWKDAESFSTWLTTAHSTIHEWFFALIDGVLLDEYTSATLVD